MPLDNKLWTSKAKELTKELHQEIRLNNHNWHKYRGNKKRRSGELIIAAMSQIINQGKDSEIEALLEKALQWIKEEVKDSGCDAKKSI